MNFITKNLVNFALDTINGVLDFFGSIINTIFYEIVNLNNNGIANSATVYTTALGVALVIFMGIKQYFDVYVMQTDGDPDEDPIEMIYRTTQSIAMIACNGWIFYELLSLSMNFADDLAGSVGSIDFTGKTRELVNVVVSSMTVGSSIFAWILLLMVIAVIVFLVVASIRGAELILMKILFPVFAVDLLTTNRERWNTFLTSYLITFFSYGIQLFCFKMFQAQFINVTIDGPMNLLVTIGWLYLMIRSPKWLEKFCYHTGLSKATGSGVRNLAMLIPKLAK